MMDSMLFESPKRSELFEKIHIRSALHAPELFEKGTRLAERMEEDIPLLVYRTGEKHSERLVRFIRDNAFDTVIATHVFAAQMLTHVESRFRESLTTAFVATDYSYIPFTSATYLDACFLPHRKLLQRYEENAPGKNYIVSGIPTSARMTQRTDKARARSLLGLPLDVPVALVMTGSMGYGDVLPLLSSLRQQATADTVITVLCGNNNRLAQTLQAAYADDAAVRTVGYTERVGLYLDASDVLLSKPGGLSSTEAAVKGIPLVHITPLPGWEEDNVSFFTELGLSATGGTPEEMAAAAVLLLSDRDAASRMTERQHAEIRPDAGEVILDTLTKFAKKG